VAIFIVWTQTEYFVLKSISAYIFKQIYFLYRLLFQLITFRFLAILRRLYRFRLETDFEWWLAIFVSGQVTSINFEFGVEMLNVRLISLVYFPPR